jgi:VIT1/CCC1 family predicted Fe2+/Mn2+ transporter
MPENQHHSTKSDFISDAVIGISDGLTVPFALAAGLSGAVQSNGIIITAGIAEIVAGCIAMGLGGYLAGQTEHDYYINQQNKTQAQITQNETEQTLQLKKIFENYGLNPEAQNIIATEISKDKRKWTQFMLKFEHGLTPPHPNRARNAALTIGIAYFLGGLLPLSAYFICATPHHGLLLSSIITSACLFVFGYFKSKITGQNPLIGALKVTAIGLIAAGCAYSIAKVL